MDIIKRSLQQISRFKTRNTVIGVQIIAIVFLITSLSTILFKLDQMYKNENLAYTKQLKVIEVMNKDMSDELLSYLDKSKKIDFYLPYSSFHPGNNLYMGITDYYIYPNYVAFYNHKNIKNLNNNDFVQLTKNDKGIIVPEKFKSMLIPKENYQELFGEEDLPNKGDLEKYQELSFPSEIKQNQSLLKNSVTFTYYEDYVSESSTSIQIPIIGSFNSDYYFEFPFSFEDLFLIPEEYQEQVLHKRSPTKPMNLIIVADNVSNVPGIINKLEDLGYTTMNGLDIFRRRTDQNKDLIKELFMFVAVVAVVSILSFVNILYGSLKERNKEIAVMKSLGISKKKFLALFSSETIILATISTVISFVIVEGLFIFVRGLIKENIISEEYFKVFHLGSESALFLFNTSWLVYGLVFLSTIILTIIVTFFPVSRMYDKPYFKLYRW